MKGGIILAAGPGTRFGASSKLLAELYGRPLLEHAIRAQCAVDELDRIVVVLGAHADELLERIDFDRAQPVVCEHWNDGQSAALRHGVAVMQGARKVIVTLGDEPLISSRAIARMLAAPPGSRAVYGGQPGHPVVLGTEHMHAIGALNGDRGARELLRGGPEIECGDLCSGRDIDTIEDLEVVRGEARAVL